MTAKISSFPDKSGAGGSPAAATIAGYSQLAGEIFQHLRELSADGPGVTRPSYGDGEETALRYLAGLAEAEGLSVRWDEAANLVVTLDGQRTGRAAIAVGSHLDSVPIGGNFDGAAGVVAGLISLIHMKRSAIVPPRAVRLYGFRGEESAWFGACYIGSRALFGELTAEDLKSTHRDTGDALESYMAKAGADVAAIQSGRKFVRAEDIAGFIELHIEQGPVLVDRKLPVGIVTGIRGNIRHQSVICRGEAGHSGTVPRWLRHDAVMATSDLLVRLDEHWRVLLERGIDLVVTSGMVSTDPAHHALSVIPGEVRFRPGDPQPEHRHLGDLLRPDAGRMPRRFGGARRHPSTSTGASARRPGASTGRGVNRLEELAGERDIACCRLPSGAGHDAAVMANAGIPSAMIFVRNEHGSHNPHESMDMGDFLKGVDLLYHALMKPVL